MSYTPPSDDVADFVRGRVASGYYTAADVEEALEWRFEASPEEAAAARRILAAELLAHENAKKAWPVTTDCDRLDAAFAALEARGITARQNFACCNTCGHNEIQVVLREARQKDREARGYVFFHMQDTDRVVRGEALHLRFGTPGRDPAADTAVARAIIGALREHGLSPTWNEDPNQTIALPGLSWQRRAPPREGLLATPEQTRRRIEGAMRGLVGADLVTATHPLGEVRVWLRDDERALAWARAAVGGVRSAAADGVTAWALSSVGDAFAARGDGERASSLWVEAFGVAPSGHALLTLVAKAPLDDAKVFEAARVRAMETDFDLWGGAVIAWLVLRGGAHLPQEERERLVDAASAVFERERPRSEYSDDNLAQSALACALVALGKTSPKAIALAEAARPKAEPDALPEQKAAARAWYATRALPAPPRPGEEPKSADAFARRARETFVREGAMTAAVRADMDHAKLDWAAFEQFYEEGIVTRAELDNARTDLAVLHAVLGEREEALAWLAPMLVAAREEWATALAPTKDALAAIAAGAPVAEAMAAALAPAKGADAVAKAIAQWSGASDRRALIKGRRHARTILAEARRLRDPSIIDLVLAKLSPENSYPDFSGLTDLFLTMTVLGRAKEVAEIAAREFSLSADGKAAYAAALLALGDRESARAQVRAAADAPLHLFDALAVAPALAGIHDDPRAAAASLLSAITDAEAHVRTSTALEDP